MGVLRKPNRSTLKKKKTNAKDAAKKVVDDTAPLERNIIERCPHCESTDFVKRGVRKNKHQEVQLYLCRNPECTRTFTARTIKGKQFPWPVVLDAISYHYLENGVSHHLC